MKKVYELYFNDQKIEAKISSPKSMQNHYTIETIERAEKEGNAIAYWNEQVFISYSRKALVDKWKEIQETLIKQKEEEIQKLKGIMLR